MIAFSRCSGRWGALSNFAATPFVACGCEWATVEHWFQAQKFAPTDPEYAEQIAGAATPAAAKRLGRSHKHPLRDDWQEVRNAAMLAGLRAKFTQNEQARATLLQTGDDDIVEHTPWRDRYWGDGGDGSGENWLGRLLMQVRAELLE